LAVVAAAVAVVFVAITGGSRLLAGKRDMTGPAWRGFSIAFGFVLALFAVRTWLSRFDRLFEDHRIFSRVSYTHAHLTIAGLTVAAAALAAGSVIAWANAISALRARSLPLALA